MTPQTIELLLFAIIAFFVISRLISVLGSSDDELHRSKFGSKDSLKDVTSSGYDWTNNTNFPNIFSQNEYVFDKNLLNNPDNENVKNSLIELMHKIENFTPEKFIQGASRAWKMILSALSSKDITTIEELVDSRFINHIKSMRDDYTHTNLNDLPNMKFSDVTFFGNSILIKLIFASSASAQEEWTFIRNFGQTGPNWFLSNISRNNA